MNWDLKGSTRLAFRQTDRFRFNHRPINILSSPFIFFIINLYSYPHLSRFDSKSTLLNAAPCQSISSYLPRPEVVEQDGKAKRYYRLSLSI